MPVFKLNVSARTIILTQFLHLSGTSPPLCLSVIVKIVVDVSTLFWLLPLLNFAAYNPTSDPLTTFWPSWVIAELSFYGYVCKHTNYFFNYPLQLSQLSGSLRSHTTSFFSILLSNSLNLLIDNGISGNSSDSLVIFIAI